MADNLPLQYQKALVGQEPTWTAASANGHCFPNQGKVEIWVKNQNAGTVEITIYTARQCEFGTHPDLTLTLAGNAITNLPSFDPRRFTDVGTGLLTFTFSQTSGVSVAAVVQQQYSQES